MTNNFHGYVVQANVPLNEPVLERHLRLIKPALVHVLNNPAYAIHLKRNVIPDSAIYLRHYDADGDGNDWAQYSAIDYFNKYEKDSFGGALGFQICNEPGFGRDVTKRLVPFMAEGVKRKIPVAPGGYSVGMPPAEARLWADHDDFVRIICEHPDLLSYSAHEYFQVLPTSGMITKQTQPGEVLYFANHLRDISDWPMSINDLTGMFHVGRCKAFVDYATSKGYGKPVLDITEHGVDDVEGGKIKEWRLKLLNGQNIRGYKPCEQQWKEWFGLDRSLVYVAMLRWIRDVIYKPLGVRGAALFTWGNSGKAGTAEDWQTFDCATDSEFQTALEKHYEQLQQPPASEPKPPAPVPAPIPPPPAPTPEPPLVPTPLTRTFCLDMASSEAALAAIHSLREKRWRELASTLMDDETLANIA